MITDLRNNKVIPFIYDVDITLTALALGSVNLTLAADSWFELCSYRASTNNADAATDFSPNYFSCLITDSGTGRQLQTTRTQQRILCGNAYFGMDQKRPIKFAPNTVLQFDFQNLVNDSLQIQFSLVGYKWFDLSNPGI